MIEQRSATIEQQGRSCQALRAKIDHRFTLESDGRLR
jgi:hypothetical protein